MTGLWRRCISFLKLDRLFAEGCLVVIPPVLLVELEKISARRNTDVIGLLRNFIKLGLIFDMTETEGGKLVIRGKGGDDVELLFEDKQDCSRDGKYGHLRLIK